METESAPDIGLAHASARLPEVEVLGYNVEIEDRNGFVGDRASKAAFYSFVDEWREPLRKIGEDPFGDVSSSSFAKKRLDAIIAKGDPETAGVVHGAIESFAEELANVVERFLKLKQWKDAEHIVFGGGMSGSRVGELAIGRGSVLLKKRGIETGISLIHHKPDEAGLIGAIHLAPAWMFEGHDAIVALDIGGTNFRAGVVRFNADDAAGIAKAKIWKFEVWRHRDEKPKRDEAVARLVTMIRRLINRAKKAKLKLAPFIGIGCPGRMEANGAIESGAQNLPGNWETSRFNLQSALRDAIPKIGDFDTVVVMHNDAVVQGLSEIPFVHDASIWGMFTIGTGLGNALFKNR